MNALDRFILAKASERAEELYNPGTYALALDQAALTRSAVRSGAFKWRYDVMVPVKPVSLGLRLSAIQNKMYRTGVSGKVELKTGKVEDDPVVTDSTLIVFWTTLWVAYDGEVWHNPEEGRWQSIGWVPKEISI